MMDTARGRSRGRCRCGHYDSEHGPTAEQRILGTSMLMPWECRLCDCRGFHTTSYKKRISQLRHAATKLRGKPLQQRLFPPSPKDQAENSGDPTNPLADRERKATP